MTHISRRRLLAAGALALPLHGLAKAGELSAPPEVRSPLLFERWREITQTGLARPVPAGVTNGDEDRYLDRRASFSKTMPHNELGEVDPEAYRKWLEILARGDSRAFEHVPRAPGAVERLNNPQATYSIDPLGVDSATLPLPPPPTFASQEKAKEMAELYWQAVMRDVAFRDLASHPLAQAAVSDLEALGFAPMEPADLFRGDTLGERAGPFVSQFLLRNIPYGLQTVEQRFVVPSRGQGFLTGFDAWLASQRGAKPQMTLRLDEAPRYISSYRELVEYVHRDFSFQPFMNAALIALGMGGDRGDAVLSPTNPYRGSTTQFGDITLGNKNLLTLLAETSLLGQKASYYYKWQLHRRARPEVFGARIDVHLGGRKSYDLHPAISESEGLARVKAEYGSWLLPQAYPEGSPTHPSYPAAHAVNAGACATILKAFLDERYVLSEPVEATADGSKLEVWRGAELTLGGEIDKLASNIALARNAAGVRFRSDSMEGLALGEEVALGLLAQTSHTYSERFDGFVLSRFDGTRVRISNGSVRLVVTGSEPTQVTTHCQRE
jgi:hypothetical protein